VDTGSWLAVLLLKHISRAKGVLMVASAENPLREET